jgi:hypothetical protein
MTRENPFTEQWLEEAKQRVRSGVKGKSCSQQGPALASISHSGSTTVQRAISSPYAPYRSKLELSWANYLQGLVRLGAISEFYYERVNIRLPGKKNWYKPDFLVLAGDGLTFYEVKGYNKSDDRSLVKMKTAAGLNPWARFVLVKRIRGNWEERTIA